MIALLLTILAEIPILFLLLKTKRSFSLIVFSAVLVNLLTNPVANMLYPGIGFWKIEAGVIVVEAVLFSPLLELEAKKGFVVSILANAPSILLSLLFI